MGQIDLRSAALCSGRLGKSSDETPRQDGNSHGFGHNKEYHRSGLERHDTVHLESPMSSRDKVNYLGRSMALSLNK